jgi:hypothetical protein
MTMTAVASAPHLTRENTPGLVAGAPCIPHTSLSQGLADAVLSSGYEIAIAPVVPVTRQPVPGWFCTT